MATEGAGKVVFVEETGLDTNNGSEGAPFKTIFGALLASGEKVFTFSPFLSNEPKVKMQKYETNMK